MGEALTRSRFQEERTMRGEAAPSRALEVKGAREKAKYQRREGIADKSPARPERHSLST